MSNFVRPISIASPSGHSVQPRLITQDHGDKVVTEAQWLDPTTGQIFKKGIVSIDGKESVNNSAVVEESCDPDVEKVLLAGATGKLDLYDIMNHPKNDVEKKASEYLYKMYERISINRPDLHPDDDFEDYFEIMAQEIWDDYGSDQAWDDRPNLT